MNQKPSAEETQKRITNLPDKIYLQLGLDNLSDDEFDENNTVDFDSLDHEYVAWCQDSIDKDDPCYVLESTTATITARIVELEGENQFYKKELNKFWCDCSDTSGIEMGNSIICTKCGKEFNKHLSK